MKSNSRISILFVLAIILQVFILLSLVVKKEVDLRYGRKIIVKTVPVDPRSLFRGDYVNLRYEFSQIDLTAVGKSKNYFYIGETVYVRLAKNQDEWLVKSISDKPITIKSADEIMLCGTVSHSRFWQAEKNIEVSYGIESYFVPEGKGKPIERDIRQKRVQVELSVNKRGYASACKLLIDGKEVKFR